MNCLDKVERGASFLDSWSQRIKGKGESVQGRVEDLSSRLVPASSSPYKLSESVVSLTPAQEIQAESIKWLWQGWLAAGKLAIIGGAPGCGKTTIALEIAAIVSRGGQYPDGSLCQLPGNVLIWSGEDDPADTLKPRLIASGADLSRCHFISSTIDREGSRPFDPARDMPALDASAERLGCVRLLIADPIVSAVAGDSHKNAEVRRSLQPIVDFARIHGCAVLGVTHFTKGTAGRDPIERITGSLAFAALARLVLVAARDSCDENGQRVLVRAKSNIGPDGGGFAYQLDMADVSDNDAELTSAHVIWGEQLEGSASKILAMVEQSADSCGEGGRGDARDFLMAQLRDHSVSVRDLKTAAGDCGISWRTLQRAKSELGVKAVKTGMAGGWMWELLREKRPKVAR